MGLTITYHFEFRGSRSDLVRRLASLRTRTLDLPIRSVSDVVEVERAANPFDRGNGRTRFEERQLDLAMLFARLDEAGAALSPGAFERQLDRITRAGNGLSVVVDVGEGCESFHVLLGRIGMGRVWRGVRFTKTQYALQFVDAHLLVVRMLDHCREALGLRRVKDDGGFWETRDLAVLARNQNLSTAMLDGVTVEVRATGPRSGLRVEAAVDRCLNRMRVESDDSGAAGS